MRRFGRPKESREFCGPGAGNLGPIVPISPIPPPESPNSHAGESPLRARLPQMAVGCPGPIVPRTVPGDRVVSISRASRASARRVECEAQFRTPHQAKRRTIHPNLTHLVFLPHSHPPPLSLGPSTHCSLSQVKAPPLLFLYPTQHPPTFTQTTGELIDAASGTTLTCSQV